MEPSLVKPQLAAYKQTETWEQDFLCATGMAIRAHFHRTREIATAMEINVFEEFWLISSVYVLPFFTPQWKSYTFIEASDSIIILLSSLGVDGWHTFFVIL